MNNNYVQLDEPINTAWESTNLNSVTQEITEEGWIDGPLEDTYEVYDSVNGWMADDGLASDAVRLFGGYHICLWSMSDGDIVGATHEDSSIIPFGHHAIGFENIEEMVAEFYDEADDTNSYGYQERFGNNPISLIFFIRFQKYRMLKLQKPIYEVSDMPNHNNLGGI